MADEIIEVAGSTPAKAEPTSGKSNKRVSVLDMLKDEISREVTRPEVEMDVPERKGVSVRFSPNITNEQLKAWRRNSTNRKTDELDSIKFSCYVIGNTVSGIYFDDELAAGS